MKMASLGNGRSSEVQEHAERDEFYIPVSELQSEMSPPARLHQHQLNPNHLLLQKKLDFLRNRLSREGLLEYNEVIIDLENDIAELKVQSQETPTRMEGKLLDTKPTTSEDTIKTPPVLTEDNFPSLLHATTTVSLNRQSDFVSCYVKKAQERKQRKKPDGQSDSTEELTKIIGYLQGVRPFFPLSSCTVCGHQTCDSKSHEFEYDVYGSASRLRDLIMDPITLVPIYDPVNIRAAVECRHTFSKASILDVVAIAEKKGIRASCPLCRTSFCRQDLFDANLITQEYLNQLPVQCPNNGCALSLPRVALPDHLKQCPMVLGTCSERFQINGIPDDEITCRCSGFRSMSEVEAHRNTDCPFTRLNYAQRLELGLWPFSAPNVEESFKLYQKIAKSVSTTYATSLLTTLPSEKLREVSARAYFILARCYAYGRGTDRNLAQARPWFLLAVRNGFARAHTEYGKILNESGTHRELLNAVPGWLEDANTGCVEALLCLTNMAPAFFSSDARLLSIYQQASCILADRFFFWTRGGQERCGGMANIMPRSGSGFRLQNCG